MTPTRQYSTREGKISSDAITSVTYLKPARFLGEVEDTSERRREATERFQTITMAIEKLKTKVSNTAD